LVTAPSCGLYSTERDIDITVVLLPWQQTAASRASEVDLPEKWAAAVGDLSFNLPHHPATFVGSEHTGVIGDPHRLVPDPPNQVLDLRLVGGSRQRLAFIAFPEWLQTLQPGQPFNPFELSVQTVKHSPLTFGLCKDRVARLRATLAAQIEVGCIFTGTYD
jgi:hypothetical protein